MGGMDATCFQAVAEPCFLYPFRGPWGRGWARVESVLGLIFHCHSCEKGLVSAKAFCPIFSLASLGPNIFNQSSALGGN